MTIEITRPELEALIENRLQSGPFRDVQDLLLDALAAQAVGQPESGAIRHFEVESGFPVLHTGTPMNATIVDETIEALRRERDLANLGLI